MSIEFAFIFDNLFMQYLVFECEILSFKVKVQTIINSKLGLQYVFSN